MTDWASGYVSEIGYTFGYYPELNPLRVQLAFLNAGLVAPDMGVACELGFGQGISTNIHAAASVSQWYGADFNPAHTSFAQDMAIASGASARLFDQSFAAFCSRSDLPDFDYIALHGIWSWISDEDRAVIVDFLHRKLKAGGVCYISYNTPPGWSATAPLRDLLAEHVQVMGVPGQGIVSRIDGALSFADKLLATHPLYAQANPQVVERLKLIKGQDRTYVAHEYFNRNWLPMPFSRMAEWLGPAKLNFACSANYLDSVLAVNFTPEQQALLTEVPDAVFRESVRDFIVNRQFRKDYWVRGARKLSVLERTEHLRQLRVLLVQPRAEVSLKFKGPLGEASLQAQVSGPLLEALADHQPKSLGQIEQEVKDKGVSFAQIVEAAMLLVETGRLGAAQSEALTAKARKQTDKLNAFLWRKARSGGENNYLASPVIGGAVAVGRIPQLFLSARSEGKKQPAEWARFVWDILASQGQKIVKDGKQLEQPDENLAELVTRAQEFADKQLPIMKALGIV